MLPTRNELMYFAMGVAVGGVVGANWSKVKPLLETFMGPAAEGFRDAFTDMAKKFGEQSGESEAAAAGWEAPEEKPKKKRRKKKSAKKAPMTAADFAQAFMFN